jgi:carbamoyl-phosphate synthase/aspartate carbamoyltransferase/dihydroorotase
MPVLTLPGLVDVHTHLRVPGGEHKEDFFTGTAAALAGGVTTVLTMPNTSPPITTPLVLQETQKTARQAIVCDVGMFAGASPEQIGILPQLAVGTAGLKIYLNDTFGPLRVEDLPTLQGCFETWPRNKVIAMHAEGPNVAIGIGLAASYNRPVHFCHISRRDEIELIAAAKQQGLPVTCEVTPHHLFLTKNDAVRLGPWADMRPMLTTKDDTEALWKHLTTTIDCIATDHAPHTREEKMSENPPPGIAGLETSLPLMLTAVQDDRLSVERLVELMATNPRRIFGLPEQPDTFVEVEYGTRYTIRNDKLYTKCGWTPFDGWEVAGGVRRVVLRGQEVFVDGKVLARPGSGHLINNISAAA